ncbi:DUF192 domain-containing protein [Candidatus Dojkabacteria bacterium]|uniref:DUF192 domain-containing protein n=1 Tax=Candidatus Dojkabacteria bacterium TaxID=2099670 RepID=A0A955L1U9_9BACT|nr:DUF192 domain-containing protein [Candidatus Dojkabacteria bacterium]
MTSKKEKLIIVAVVLSCFFFFPFLLSKLDTSSSDLSGESLNTVNTTEDINDSSVIKFKAPNGNEISLEVAKSFEKRLRGLMYRTEMDENTGMIFIFEDEDLRTFHMGNTYISLDMIFLDKDLKVVTIHKNTKVNQSTELYSSSQPAMYVIEMNAGWADNNAIKIGDIFKSDSSL